LLGAAAIELGLPPLSSLRVLNQASLLLLCVLIYALALQLLGSRVWAAVAALLVGAHPSFAYWATSGLETASYCAACYAGIYASKRVASRWALGPGLALLLAALTRFEGPVVFAAVLAPLALSAIRQRSLSALRVHLPWIALFVLGYLGYFLFRYQYFGHLLSNSAYYKARDVNSRFSLILQFAAQNAALIVLAAFADWRRLGASGATALGMIAVYTAGFYGVKDSVADFHRFFLPVVPALVLLAVSALHRLWPAQNAGRGRGALAGSLFALALAFDLLHPVSGLTNVSAEVRVLDTRIESRALAASLIAEHFPSAFSVAVDDAGVIGFVLENRILDIFGLNDEQFVHRYARRQRSYERSLLAQSPALVVAASSNPNVFRACYSSSYFLIRDRAFGQRYKRFSIVRSPREDYHYFIFVRRDLVVAPLRALPLRRELGLAAMVEDLASRVRNR
jgi:hypothetical protein